MTCKNQDWVLPSGHISGAQRFRIGTFQLILCGLGASKSKYDNLHFFGGNIDDWDPLLIFKEMKLENSVSHLIVDGIFFTACNVIFSFTQ